MTAPAGSDRGRPGRRADDPPVVSVVIPSRDRPDQIEATVRSALAQTDAEVEVVVVDDGSREPCADALRPVRDTRLRVLRVNRPSGVAAARNAGVRAASGRWIAFLDDDDRWAPDKLATLVDATEAAGADAAVSDVLAVDSGGRVFDEIPAPPPSTLPDDILRVNVIPAGPSNVMVRRALLLEVGPFDESFEHLDDWDMWIRLAQAGAFVAVARPLVGYRYHGTNRSFLEPRVLSDEFDRLSAKHRALAARAGVVADRVDFGRFLAWTPRRAGRRWAAARAYWSLALRERDAGSAVRGAAVLLGEDVMRVGSGKPATRDAPGWAVS